MSEETSIIGSMNLRLTIKVLEISQTFTLEIGKPFILGRDDAADFKIARKSVSTQHLQLLWTGTDLHIKDLASSNGTYRMPQDSPFVEAIFPLRFHSLVLKLSNLEVELSWEPEAEVAFEATAIDPGTTQIAEKTAPVPVPVPIPVELVPGPFMKNPHPEPLKLSGEQKVQLNLETATWFFMSLSSLGLLAISIAWGRQFLDGIARVPITTLRVGGITDVVLLWLKLWRDQTPRVALLVLVLLYLASVLRSKSLRGKIGFTANCARFLPWLGSWLALATRVFFVVISTLIFIAAFTWPLIWAHRLGTGLSILPAAMRFLSLQEDSKLALADKIEQLRTLILPLQGSSLLYKELFNAERAQVLAECGGIGSEAEWEAKKKCLLSLHSIGVETFSSIQPALLFDIAARTAVLLGLDGIARVISTEGSASTTASTTAYSTVAQFLNSLDAAGLTTEKNDIQQLVGYMAKDQDASQIEENLRNLRHRMELQLEAEQQELHYPALFLMEVPGPLETGI